MRMLLFRNAGLKISAVLLAMLLWFFVTSRGQSELTLEVPVEFASVPAGLGIAASSVKNVAVTVRGQEGIMKNAKPSTVRVLVDLEKAKRGESVYHISKDDIRLPYAMTATNVAPSSVRVRLEETLSKSVAVKPVITGSPDNGFVIKTVEVAPREVSVQGLRSEVRRVNEVRTEPLDVSGSRETVSQELNMYAGDVSIRTDPVSVKVTVVIGRR